MKEEKVAKFKTGSPISWLLHMDLRNLYFDELKKCLQNNGARTKIHCHTGHGVTSFVMATAVWESFLNETFMADHISHIYRNNILYDIQDECEKWNILTKTVMYPKFLFGRRFNKSTELYSRLNSMIQIRNNIVHFKYSAYEGPEKPLKNLRALNVSYEKSLGIECPWHLEISSTECIRFCVNVINELVTEIAKLADDEHKWRIWPETYPAITDAEVYSCFKKYGVDPNTSYGNLLQAIS